MKTYYLLPQILGLVMSISPVLAVDITSNSSSTQTTMTLGEPTVIQHVESKMEPTAIQTTSTVDAKTGVQTTETAPIIMERHDKVLDTTVIQPEVVETKTTKEQVVKTAKNHSVHVAHRTVPKHYVHSSHPMIPVHTQPIIKASRTKVLQTTETTDRAVVKETVIHADHADSPSPAPQVIEKTEVKSTTP